MKILMFSFCFGDMLIILKVVVCGAVELCFFLTYSVHTVFLFGFVAIDKNNLTRCAKGERCTNSLWNSLKYV